MGEAGQGWGNFLCSSLKVAKNISCPKNVKNLKRRELHSMPQKCYTSQRQRRMFQIPVDVADSRRDFPGASCKARRPDFAPLEVS